MMLWYTELSSIDLSIYKTINDNKRISRYNIEAAFDIETTSIYDNDLKHAFMYIWMFGIDKYIFYGRKWEEFKSFISNLASRLELNYEKRLVVYVHVLQFEFQFLHQIFEWEKVFSLRPHKPIYAITSEGIEFRCSYMLSGLNLDRTAKNLTKHTINKKVGMLDYEKIRHHETPLTDEELEYCEYDIKVLLAYINEQIEEYHNNINQIPMTNTGRVRNFCRNATLRKDFNNYHRLMRDLTLTVDEYEQMKRAFQGGFTHANYNYVNKIVNNVSSFDLASSYPSTMVSDMYPMSKPTLIEPKSQEDFDYYISKYCCIFDAEFFVIVSTKLFENPISESRCYISRGTIVNNGRIMMADHIGITITDQDYKNISAFYEWEKIKISNMRIMKRGYLPRDFILAILNMYKNKTTLKGVKEKEAEYMRSKNMINSAYGMTVTDIARPEIKFQSTGDWDVVDVDLERELSRYNKSKRRFLYYPWGVWVTAYARRNLFSAILEFGEDYVYSDTDSVKVLNKDKHVTFIQKYNENMKHKLQAMCEEYEIDFELTRPKSPDGKEKPIGIWEYEGTYSKFKTLGAKRYMVEIDGKLNITVAGVNKNHAVPYLLEKYKDPFEAFSDGLIIPANNTGKLTHTYIEEEGTVILVTDYLGITAEVTCGSGVHLEKAQYELSISSVYAEFLKGYQLMD